MYLMKCINASSTMEGEVCINYSGAEFFAKEDYQKSFGGAYILVPLANEKRNEEGEVVDSWSETYANLLYNLINEFNEEEVAMSLEKIMAYCNFCVIIIL